MMTAELPKSYAPAESETEIRARWEASGAFRAEPDDAPDAARPYCILIPPPNVTAPLHLGHAFNNTLQDALTRYHRMRGYNTLWMPGTDHAGIATQTVVEKRLLNEGIKRREMGREAFVSTVQVWKDEYEATITEQLQAMGCSCDWERQRFTMDPMCATAVREAFFRLFRDGLIYRGKRLVNWDPVTLTALADDEVEMKDVHGHMWYLRYPLVDGSGQVTVATTRPETMLGDTAIAVNPNDPRAADLVGKQVRLPIVDRVIPIIADDYVVLPREMGGDASDPKSEIATGFLKVTPAHDQNDWEIGQRHGLDVINVLSPEAAVSTEHGWEDCSDEARQFVGMSREDARTAIVKWFKGHDLLESVRDYSHSVGHSYRSHVPIEPYLSDQWYVKVTDDRLVGEAQRALVDEQFDGEKPERQCGGDISGDNELRFFPARYAKMYQSWHENLRDWCISRQLWWGHRIPVWRNPAPKDLSPDRLARFAEKILEWQRDGRIATQYRGEFVPLESIEKGHFDLVAFFVCVRDPEGEDSEIVRFLERNELEQDPDVLDTWFSSGLWPLSTMGWPEPDAFPDTVGLLETFNPSSVLSTGRDIVTLWVSRMVMFNRYFNHGKVPYRHVYVHPMIQDGRGQRMSKSLGNGVDPRDLIHSHGADGLRFVLAQIATTTQDVRLTVDMVCPHCEHAFHPKEITSPAGYRVAAPEQQCSNCGKGMISLYGSSTGIAMPSPEKPLARNSSTKFDVGRNFCNKLWNATRFALANLTATDSTENETQSSHEGLSLIDRWMLARLAAAVRAVEAAIAEYQFSVYASTMYDLVWGDFCDWYLEGIKTTVKSDPAQQQVLRTVLNAIVRLLHPICPFVTETLWPFIQETGPAGIAGISLPPSDLLCTAAWPVIAGPLSDDSASEQFAEAQLLVTTIRNLRSEHTVPPRKKIGLLATSEVRDLITATGAVVPALAGLEGVETLTEPPENAVPFIFEGAAQALIGLVESVDRDAEIKRLTAEIADLEKKQANLEAKLANPGYVNGAPAHIVQETREILAETVSELQAKREMLAKLRNET